MQTITLKGYGTNIPPYEAIELGTYDSYGVEQLQIVPSHGWENLSIIASFFPPSGAEPIKVAVLSGGIIDVPPGATAKQSGKGIIVFAGYKANTQLISTNVAYNIRDHKDIASGDPVCPTPSVVEQIMNAAKAAQENAEKAAGSAKKAEDVAASVRNDADEGKFNGEDGAQVDDSSIGDKPWSSKHIIDMLCPPLEESGNPVVCYPVAGYTLGVKAKWEPMQDGSGTPYPAGGGSNKLNVAGIVSNRTISGITFTVNADGTIGVNGTSTAICFLNPNTKFNKAYLQKIPAGTYRLDFAQTALGVFLFGYYEDGSETPIVYAGNVVTYAQDAYVGPQIRIAAGATVNTTVRLMLHTGTSTPSAYAGWENIRPITGRASVKVERCGENLLPFGERIEDIYSQQIMASDDLLLLSRACAGQKLTLTFSVETQNIVFKDTVDEEWRKRIGFECHGTLADGAEVWDLQCWLSDSDGELTKNGKKTKTVTVTMPKLANGDIMFYAQNIKSGSFVAYDFGIYAGTTAPTAYTPYIGQTTPLTLPETVYGGEVDAVTGDGNNNTKIITLDGNKLKFSQSTIYLNLPMHSAPGISARGIICCSHFNSTRFGVNTNYEFCFILVSDIADLFANADDLNAYLAAQYAAGTPVQIAYKLATPTPFTATGAQPIPALAGVNTVLTDADSATVTGRADPIKRIIDLEDAVASQT